MSNSDLTVLFLSLLQGASPAVISQVLKSLGGGQSLPLSPELAAAAAAAAAANAAGDPLGAVQRLAAALAAGGAGAAATVPGQRTRSNGSNNNNNNNGESPSSTAANGDDGAAVDMKVPPAISLPGSGGGAAQGHQLAAAAAAAAGLPFSSDLLWRLPNPFVQQPPPSPLDAGHPARPGGPQQQQHVPCGLAPDPRTWNREDVAVFMRYCEREFDLERIDMEKFQMNGEKKTKKNEMSQFAAGG